MRKPVHPDGVATPKPAYSPAIVAGDFIYTSGQVGRDINYQYADGLEAQTRQTFENVRACLEAAGATLDDVIQVSGFITSPSDFPEYDRIYREYLTEPFPARTTLFTDFGDDTLIEVAVVAYVGDRDA
jgi:2-iminobutanoate/2-iminopropanoate deaminase